MDHRLHILPVPDDRRAVHWNLPPAGREKLGQKCVLNWFLVALYFTIDPLFGVQSDPTDCYLKRIADSAVVRVYQAHFEGIYQVSI